MSACSTIASAVADDCPDFGLYAPSISTLLPLAPLSIRLMSVVVAKCARIRWYMFFDRPIYMGIRLSPSLRQNIYTPGQSSHASMPSTVYRRSAGFPPLRGRGGYHVISMSMVSLLV